MNIFDTDMALLLQERLREGCYLLERIALALEENNRLTRAIYSSIPDSPGSQINSQEQTVSDKGRLKPALEEARKDVNDRLDWHKNQGGQSVD